MIGIIRVPEDEFFNYEKYLPPQWLFTDNRLADSGIYNLKFKNIAVIPSKDNFGVFDQMAYQFTWLNCCNVCRDCPPTETQKDFARIYCLRDIHYQHWTYNSKETYEQMVGDNLYEGINCS